MGLGLVEAEVQSFQHVAHHFQRFLYIFSAHDHKVVRIAHKVCLRRAFAIGFAAYFSREYRFSRLNLPMGSPF
jgi:hypothetical protein